MTVIVYSKPACVQCTATTRALDAKGIGYKLVDLATDDEAMERVELPPENRTVTEATI